MRIPRAVVLRGFADCFHTPPLAPATYRDGFFVVPAEDFFAMICMPTRPIVFWANAKVELTHKEPEAHKTSATAKRIAMNFLKGHSAPHERRSATIVPILFQPV